MFDTHAHIHDPSFDADRTDMLERARLAGVTRILTVGCDLADSARALEVARAHGLAASIGVHPHEAKGAPADVAAALDALRASGVASPLAVGETGLDYYYAHSPREIQREVFTAQLRYARERALPLIFHQRNAFDDFVRILRDEFAPPMRGVVHCFTGDAAQARTLVDEFALKLGIGGVVTFKTADALRDAVREAGLAHIVLETDCPYLAPVPHRGKRNEPAFMPATAARLAELFASDVEEIVARTNANADALFGA
jgi:TatD DNase family protein